MNTNEFYFFHDTSGCVVEAGTCNADALKTKFREGCSLVIGLKAALSDGYTNGKCYTPPPTPNEHHRFNYSTQQWVANSDAAWASIKLKRSVLLSNTDWVVTKAAEAGQTVSPEWVEYRQALRNITVQADPWGIVWPIKPI